MDEMDEMQNPAPVREVSYLLPSGHSLTWSIWHRLPRDEKLKIARTEGMTIGAFEENVALFMAIEEEHAEDENATLAPSLPRPPQKTTDTTTTAAQGGLLDAHSSVLEKINPYREGEDSEDSDCDDASSFSSSAVVPSLASLSLNTPPPPPGSSSSPAADDPSDPTSPATLLTLPTFLLLHSVYPYLPLPYLTSILPVVHPSLSPPDTYYAFLNARKYPKGRRGPTRRLPTPRLVHERRPWPSLGCGTYVHKATYIKEVTRDMWTCSSLVPGAPLKAVWYRHVVFLEGGKGGYIRSTREGEGRQFEAWLRGDRSRVKEMQYEVKKGVVLVKVEEGHLTAFYEARIREDGNMDWERHYAVVQGKAVEYKIPPLIHGELPGFRFQVNLKL